MPMLPILIALVSAAPSAPHELYDYLNRKDSSYRFEVKDLAPGRRQIDLTSQTWQGIPWHHTVLLQSPTNPSSKGTAVLYITGDGPKAGDYRDIALIAGAAQLPIAMLFDIPNQPIWDLREDGLIAHTFTKYLETKDATWPLLFPMVKSALRAMDAVEEATKNTDNPITKFVITGGSKRGWTTWFVGASKDPRVLGIAPMVYDNLNVAAQMRHQIDNWGKYSEMIEEYTRRGLQARLDSKEGAALARIVDPFSYRSNIRVPTLIVNGANDPYWSADSTSLYWNDLRQPHWLLTVPNAGHTLGTGLQAIESIGAFARSAAGQFAMPKPKWKFDLGSSTANPDGRELTVQASSEAPPFRTLRVWAATSDTLDFRDANYVALGAIDVGELDPKAKTAPVVKVLLPKEKNAAVFAELRYKIAGREFSICTPTRVYKK